MCVGTGEIHLGSPGDKNATFNAINRARVNTERGNKVEIIVGLLECRQDGMEVSGSSGCRMDCVRRVTAVKFSPI